MGNFTLKDKLRILKEVNKRTKEKYEVLSTEKENKKADDLLKELEEN